MTEPAESFGPAEGFVRDDDLSGVLDDLPLTVEESLDSDDLGDTDAGQDPLDDSWDAPDRPSSETRQRLTATERLAGSSLDDQLSQEIPDVDPYRDAERSEAGYVLEDDVAGVGTPVLDVEPESRPGGLVADGPFDGDPLVGWPVARPTPDPGDDGGWPLAPEDDALHLD
jgi:hypothetical protein